MTQRLAIVEEFDYMITVKNTPLPSHVSSIRLGITSGANRIGIYITNPEHLRELARQLVEAAEELEAYGKV